MTNTAVAKLKTLNISPRKVRLVVDVIRGMHVVGALAQLDAMPNRSAGPLSKLLKSAIVNATEKNMDKNKLVIKSMTVDQGPVYKRIQPRSRGRATPIRKATSHINIELVEDPSVVTFAFTLPEKQKKVKKEKKSKKAQEKSKVDIGEDNKTRKGFADKVFRRKAV